MITAPADQGQRWRPFSSGGIVQFGGRWENAVKIVGAAGNQDLSVGQQRGGVNLPREAHRTGWGPDSRSRIVKLRAGTRGIVGGAILRCEEIGASGDEHLAVWQQRRRVRAT